jgi:PhzF family phenazine biosynthesis protein
MLNIAGEFGFSETAFILETKTIGTYTIRFFSPKKEIPLCGHATLASAKVIFTHTSLSELQFVTVENIDLWVKKRNEEIQMEFPVYDTTGVTVSTAMLAALGIENVSNTVFSPNNKIILIEISDSGLLTNLNPNFNALLTSHNKINGVLVTAPSHDGEYDFHYRYFWPWAGTNEDPVTGGVQTFLAKYWSEKLGKTKMNAFQSSRRTGAMTVELQKDKVLLFGQAVIVFEGNLVLAQ